MSVTWLCCRCSPHTQQGNLADGLLGSCVPTVGHVMHSAPTMHTASRWTQKHFNTSITNNAKPLQVPHIILQADARSDVLGARLSMSHAHVG